MKQQVSKLSHRTPQLSVIAGLILSTTMLTVASPSARAGEPITADTVAQRVAAAKTAQDHAELAAYFRSQGAAIAEDVKRHEAMLQSYDWVWGVTNLEPIWNRHYVKSVQITMAERFGVEGRGRLYEEVGAIRDVIQNHMLQVVGPHDGPVCWLLAAVAAANLTEAGGQ